MNKLILATAAIATLSLAATASAQDDWSDDAGGFGVGVDRAINGLSGASFRYNLNNQLGFEGILGMNQTSRTFEPEGGDSNTQSTRMIDFSLLADYRVASSSRAALAAYGGVGFNMFNTKDDAGDVDISYTDMAIELGARGEVWLYDFFSIYGRFGITYDPYSSAEFNYDALNEDAADGFETIGGADINMFRGDILGLFGFTFWMQ